MKIGILTGMIVWFCAVGVQAHVLVLTPQMSRVPLDRNLQFVEDPDGTTTLDRLIAEDRMPWQQHESDAFNKGYSASTWYVKLQVRMDAAQVQRWLLEIAYPVLDRLEAAVLHEDGRIDKYRLGDKLPYHERPVDHRYFILPLVFAPGETVTIYLRIRSSSSIQAPMILWEESMFYGFDNTRTTLQSLYFGIMLAIILYNLLIYIALGERVYIYYVAYVLCMAMFLFSLGGFSFRYLWPTATQWNDQSILVFLAGLVVFGSLFTRRFLSLALYSALLDRVMMVCALLGGAMIASAFFISYGINIRLLIPMASATCAMGLIVGVYTWTKGEPTAKYYCIAWSAMLLGGILLALSKFNVLPAMLLTDYGVQVGSAMEVVLLSFALAERINVERKLRYEAQSLALESQMKANKMLEECVQERTKELESLNRRLQELSDTDKLTGLFNRRYLDALLDREWARCLRGKHYLSVLLIDVDHFKPVNDTHGHLTGDHCLQVLAERIQSILQRQTDTATRYGGEEFCVVLPQTDPQGAFIVAERIRKKVQDAPIVSDDLVLHITISIGVAAIVPDADVQGVQSLLRMADEALYRSKTEGRNRVSVNPQPSIHRLPRGKKEIVRRV